MTPPKFFGYVLHPCPLIVRYSTSPPEFDPSSDVEMDLDFLQPGIAPALFRSLAGRGHQEFSGKRQQDAMEYLEHLLKLVERSSKKTGLLDPGHCFSFGVGGSRLPEGSKHHLLLIRHSAF